MTKKLNEKRNAVAVALNYTAGMNAPVVTAKGEQELVAQMRKIARRYGIAQVNAPGLAQKLSKLKEQQQIPLELYRDVAEVFARTMVSRNKRGK